MIYTWSGKATGGIPLSSQPVKIITIGRIRPQACVLFEVTVARCRTTSRCYLDVINGNITSVA
jgi:hypothetical protein